MVGMFAVPGWSVPSSALKTQTEPPSKKSPANSNSGAQFTEDSRSKKRKRARSRSNNTKVSVDNLSDLWEQITQSKVTNPVRGTAVKTSRRGEKRLKKDKSGPEQNLMDEDVRSEFSKADTQLPPPNDNPLEQNMLAASSDPNPIRFKQAIEQSQSTSLTRLQASMQQKLASARFRHLNQTLYTTPSSNALQLFQQDPEMFSDYHEGFRRQVEIWPENPVDGYIRTLKERGKKRKGSWIRNTKELGQNPAMGENKRSRELTQLPRTEGVCTVADLGCGDAKLAQAVEDVKKKLKINVLSYDLHSSSKFVTLSDISQLPLKDGSVDVAIFCLSLMGTNWIAFVEEAWRVLRWKGELWVAEIKSRFGRVGKCGAADDISNKKGVISPAKRQNADDEDQESIAEVDSHIGGRHDTDVSALVDVFRKRGFALQGDTAVDMSNKMFVKLNFIKTLMPVKGKGVSTQKGGVSEETWRKRKFLDNCQVGKDESAVLKPCVYKIR